MSFRADLVSSVFERWRYGESAFRGLYQLKVYDQGDELTVTTDYEDEGDGVLALVAEAGEPLTVEVEGHPDDPFLRDLGGLDKLIEGIAVDLGPVAAVDHRRLCSLYANRALLWTRKRPAVELVAELLKGVLGYALLANDGVLTFDALLPPTAPGPRGEACVEIASAVDQASGITWATGQEIASEDFTLAGWFKLQRSGPNDSPWGDNLLLRLEDDQGGGFVREVRFNVDWDTGVPQIELDSYTSGIRDSQRKAGFDVRVGGPGTGPLWVFLAVVHDSTAGTTEFFGAPEGSTTLEFLGSDFDLNFASGTPSFTTAQVGGDLSDFVAFPWYRGGVAEPQVWNAALTQTAVQNILRDTLPNTTGRTFWASLAGTSTAALTDVETSTVGTVTGFVRERPDLTLDLTATPRPLRRRRIVPAKSINVHYGRNYNPLQVAEFAAAVGASDRQRLAREWQTVPYSSSAVADDYRDARDVVIHSPWMTRNGALATFRHARYWHHPGREFAALGPTPDAPLREGLLLEPGDEVELIGYQDLADGLVYRVEANQRSLGAFDCQLSMRR